MNAAGYFITAALLLSIFFAEGQEIFLPVYPLRVSSGFGKRIHPISKKPDWHRGVDLPAKFLPVRVVMQGEVLSCGYDGRLGNYVRVSHGQLQSIYGHLSMVFCAKGDQLSGSIIGVSGQTGCATGAHLHFALSYRGVFINPLQLLLSAIDPPAQLKPK